MNTRNKARYGLFAAAILVALTLSVFFRVIHGDFITTDDGTYITNNPHVTAGLTLRGVAWAFGTGRAGNWHPLTWMSHMLDCSLYGKNPAGHHLTSLLLHMANVLLLFFVLVRMTGYTWRSAFVAALFAVHPLHVESVAWAAERKDVLSAFFWLLTMWAYVRYAERPLPARYALVLATFALGLMAKPVLVTLPFVLLLLDYWPLGRLATERKSRLVLEKAPLFALVVVSSVVTYLVQQRSGAVSSLDEFPFGVRAANAVAAYMSYVGKMLVPRNMAIMYPHPQYSLPHWLVAGSAILLALLTLAVLMGRKHRYLAVGWFWYLGTLVPMIGLVQVGSQAMADRYTYLPLVGLFIILAWGIPDLLRSSAVRILTLSACIVIICLAFIARIQVGYWKDAYTVFMHANKATRDNYLANNELGNVMSNRGRLDEAVRYYSRALELYPHAEKSHLGLGIVLAREGKIDQAIGHFSAAIAADPEFAEGHFALGRALSQKGKLNEAVGQYLQVARLNPEDARPYRAMGDILDRQGKPEEALSTYRKALKIDPRDSTTHYRIAGILIRQKDVVGAMPELEQAVKLKPDFPEAQYDLGVALASQGDLDRAISHFIRAVKIRPRYVRARERLAMTYYLKGDYAGAWKEVHLCRKYGCKPDAEFVKALREKMPER